MTVYYRLCGIASTNPSPIYQEDKFKLNELCLKSFVEAYKDVKPYVFFLLDHCGTEYVDLLEKEVPFEFDFEMSNIGINATCLKQYELASQSDDDIFLFQECDYVYQPNSGKSMEEAIRHFDLVSPYDHPDFYSRYDIHPVETSLEIFNNHHYRQSRRNTMTFGMTKKAFTETKHILDKYGYLDSDVWIELATHGYKLWTPLPGFATHCAKDYLSPAISWETIWEQYK